MTVQIVQADARALPLPDASVDLIVTSPPYYGLRSYTDGGEHYAGQIGAEATPAEYIATLIDCTREWMRVLKPTGSIWVNLGDKYVADNRGSGGDSKRGDAKYAPAGRRGYVGEGIMPRKSLMMLPERYRIACIDQLALIARAVVVWSKPNALPESVTDRVRRSHEDWVHLTKAPRYYSAVDEIRKPHARQWGGAPNGGNTYAAMKPDGAKDSNLVRALPHPLGKLPGSVWEIATEPLKVPADLGVDHFAAFPTEWPRRIILGWSPSGICVECGEGRRPVVDRRRAVGTKVTGPIWAPSGKHSTATGRRHTEHSLHIITGEACACPEPIAPTQPAVVLDPFGGTGTTALVAHVLGRTGISADLSADYCRIATWRTADPGQLAKAMRVKKPPKPMKGQPALFEMGGS